MRTYGTIEEEIVQRLKDKIGEQAFHFRSAPNTQAEFARAVDKPTVTVIYTESKFTESSMDGSTNEELMSFNIDIQGRSRALIAGQSANTDTYTLIEAVKIALVGFQPTGCYSKIAFKEGTLTRFEQNEWHYSFIINVKAQVTSDDEIDLGELLRSVIFDPINIELGT